MDTLTKPISAPRRRTTADTVYPILLLVSVTHLLNDMMQSVIPAVYPLLKAKFGFSFAQIGLITLVFQMTSSILQPFVGRYADRHPRPYSLAAGMCFTLAGLFALALAPGFAPILLAVALIGWGSSIFHPESSRVAQLASGGRKGLAQSIFQVGGNAGSAFGPLLAALVVIPYGQTSIMWFAPAALLAIGILLRIGNWYKRQLTAATAAPVTATAAAAELPRRKIRRALLILTVLVFSKYFYIACMTNYFTFFLMDKFAFSVQDAQYSLFAFLAASAAGTVIGGPLGDRIGRKYVIWGSILGAAPFALMLPYAGSGGAVALAILVGLIISSAFSAIVVYATDLMPGRVGMIAGLFFGLMFGLGGLGSAFFGWLADRTSIHLPCQRAAAPDGDHHGIPARRRTQTMIHYQSPLNFHGHDAIHPPLPLTARHDHTGCRQRRPDRTLVRRAEIFRRDARRPARRDDAADIRADPPLAGQLFRRERSGTDAAPAPARFTVPAGRVGNSAANPLREDDHLRRDRP